MPDTDRSPLRPIHTGRHWLRDLPGDSDRAAWLAGRIEDTRARIDALAGDLVQLEALAEMHAGAAYTGVEIRAAKNIAGAGAAPRPAAASSASISPDTIARMEALGIGDWADAALFERFLREWPTSAADSPTRLRAAWDALTPADRQAAVEFVPAYLARLEEAQRRYIPSGAQYLREKRWKTLAVTSPADPGPHGREDPATGPAPEAQ